ncbi:DUF4926 domain-containing protein [Methylobacterium dankookense]|nr:DUF4926 domain-containing protein [Methylobacterium dankookense]
MPAGATGTIVEVLGGGDAYIVEFLHPAHAVLTLRADALGGLN